MKTLKTMLAAGFIALFAIAFAPTQAHADCGGSCGDGGGSFDGKLYADCGGCGGCGAKAEAKADDGKIPAEYLGKKAVCPVMGGEFTIKDGTEFSKFDGQYYFFCCAGCKPKFDKDSKKYLKAIPKKLIGAEKVCPVMGGKHKVSDKTEFSYYKGQVYTFCCAGCKPKFDKNPEKYLKK